MTRRARVMKRAVEKDTERVSKSITRKTGQQQLCYKG
jgi:hypothetical protein